MTDSLRLARIGVVRSPLVSRELAPKQGDASCPLARVVVDPSRMDALLGLTPGTEIEILTWLHLADRSVLQCHPREDASRPLRGVFATRSPDRPNPIGLHRVRLLSVHGNELTVHPLEAIDGTPVVDIKSADRERIPVSWGPGVDHAQGQALCQAGRDAWLKGLVSGFNGNLSCRSGQAMVITRSGSAKGHLTPEDLVCLALEAGESLPAGASSETPMHRAVYCFQPRAQAVVHTHPPHLLALSLRVPGDLLDLPLFETGLFRHRLARLASITPGTVELAHAVGEAARDHDAVFLDNHGLVCWGADPVQALALTEELDSLARIRLLTQTP